MLVGMHNNVVILCDPQKQVGVGATHGSPVLEILFADTQKGVSTQPRYRILERSPQNLFHREFDAHHSLNRQCARHIDRSMM
jgi:hypothetical protein